MKLKVVFIITGLATGGAETMLYKLLRHLDRNYFDPIVISLMDGGEIGSKIELMDIPVFKLGMIRKFPSPFAFFRLVRILRRLHPDIVQTWMYHADLIGGLAARCAGSSRLVWGIRHSNLSRDQNKRRTLLVVAVCARLSTWLPDLILSCSLRAKEIHKNIGYPEEKIHVIPNGFDLLQFVPDISARDRLRSELGIVPDAPLVGLIARYDSQKNHLGFLQAAHKVLAEFPNVHFVMAGTGVDEANLVLKSSLKKKPDLRGNFHLLGRRSDIHRIMPALDVLASPSHGEGFPNVLGEAMACGVACVVTDVGDSAEIVGDTGYVVAPGDMPALADGLLNILNNSSERRLELGFQARERIMKRYEILSVVGLYQEIYARLASKLLD